MFGSPSSEKRRRKVISAAQSSGRRGTTERPHIEQSIIQVVGRFVERSDAEVDGAVALRIRQQIRYRFCESSARATVGLREHRSCGDFWDCERI